MEKNKGEFLFPFSGRTAYNRLQAYCECAGIQKGSFHALRATCIKFAQLQARPGGSWKAYR